MKTILKINLAITALCVLLSGCASYNVSYLKSSEPQPKISQVFMLVNDSLSTVQYGTNIGYQNNFMNTLSQNISSLLLQNGIKNKLKIYSSVYSLDTDDDIALQINSYAPDVIMNIKREQSTLLSGKYGSSYNGGVYSVTLTRTGSKKPFWKAVVQSNNETFSQLDDYESLAKQIIDKMKADGII